jgi:hypothetical protein
MNMKTALLVLSLTAIGLPAVAVAQPVKVFLFTRPSPGSASVDEEFKARQDAVRDVSRDLEAAKYRKLITVVQSRDAADLVVELVSRGETTRSSSSSSTRSVGGGGTASASRSASETKRHLRFAMTAGGVAEELTTEGQQPWIEMAERAAGDLAKWTADNQGRLRTAAK